MLTQGYDIIYLTETWLRPDVRNDALFIDNYTMCRIDRETNSKYSKHAGGVIEINKRFLHQEVKLRITRADSY